MAARLRVPDEGAELCSGGTIGGDGVDTGMPLATGCSMRADRCSRLADRQRILVVGSGGAGKSTFARALGQRTGLPVVHLDRVFWQPGWTPMQDDAWRSTVAELVADEAWIIDGNYAGTLDVRVLHCDAVVFFDFGRLTCLWGVVRRVIAHAGRSRPDMAEGCPERFDWTFVRWLWRFPEDVRPRVVRAIEHAGAGVEVAVVRSRRDARALLDECARAGDHLATAPGS